MTAPFSDTELHQLLGRPVRASVDAATRRALRQRHVLVTGAGGSIGSELARELAACQPGVLGLVDHSEAALFAIERELRHRWPEVRLEVALADVTRAPALARVCRDVQPEVVYHAAAYKHVTMAERAPAAAALVNVIGTVETAVASARVGARFVLISSDKAADPESVMGATKRVAELAVLAMASPTFRPIVVRFGNVLGSSGSVLPIMREAVRRGLPVPITDPMATRFFMTASEAVALVLKADLLGRAAEIVWLEMGQPIAMGALAARLLDLEQAAGFARVPIEVIGLRAGEKRDEILADPGLEFERTIDERIRVARQPLIDAVVDRPGSGRRVNAAGRVATLVARLRRAALGANDLAVLEALAGMPGGFRPSQLALDLARREPAEPSRRGRAA
jgi:FlaA1/EpsC-like NDP-sugar epimerase